MNYKDDKYSYLGTNYPKIYSKTYWGGGKWHDGENTEGVFNARNKFIEDYNIKDCLKKKVPFIDKICYHYCLGNLKNNFDHREYYKTTDSNINIMVTSPYMEFETNNIELWEQMEKIGWKKYESMYNGAFTYILVINKYHLRQLKPPPKYAENRIY
tara:strand:- start:1242 stop:1709 length:468 start_codon:yes stop_codon:yes gene_type:complete